MKGMGLQVKNVKGDRLQTCKKWEVIKQKLLTSLFKLSSVPLAYENRKKFLRFIFFTNTSLTSVSDVPLLALG